MAGGLTLRCLNYSAFTVRSGGGGDGVRWRFLKGGGMQEVRDNLIAKYSGLTNVKGGAWSAFIRRNNSRK